MESRGMVWNVIWLVSSHIVSYTVTVSFTKRVSNWSGTCFVFRADMTLPRMSVLSNWFSMYATTFSHARWHWNTKWNPLALLVVSIVERNRMVSIFSVLVEEIE